MWTAKLQAAGLHEFHAYDCEQGTNEFSGRTDRKQLQREFIDLIGSADIHGVFAAIDLRGWDEVADVVGDLRAEHGMSDPYYVAFQQLMETIAIGMEHLPPDRRLHLVFDNRDGHGKVIRLYDSLKGADNPHLAFVADRLGSIAFADSKQLPGLQAADLLAYEVRKHFVECEYAIVPKPLRPQWQLLQRRLMYGQHFPRGSISDLVEVFERQWRNEADQYAQDRNKARVDRAQRAALASSLHLSRRMP